MIYSYNRKIIFLFIGLGIFMLNLVSAVPTAPTNLHLISANAQQVDLEWDGSLDSQDGFSVENSVYLVGLRGWTSWVQRGSVGAGTSDYSDSAGIWPNTLLRKERSLCRSGLWPAFP